MLVANFDHFLSSIVDRWKSFVVVLRTRLYLANPLGCRVPTYSRRAIRFESARDSSEGALATKP